MVGRPTRRPDRTTAVNSGRRRRRGCAGNTSGGELLATLAPTAGDDRPARAGAHPQPEAVGLGPATIVRLERALAHEVLPLHGVGGRVSAGRRSRSECGSGAAAAAPGDPGSWFLRGRPRTALDLRGRRVALRTPTSITEDRRPPAAGRTATAQAAAGRPDGVEARRGDPVCGRVHAR